MNKTKFAKKVFCLRMDIELLFCTFWPFDIYTHMNTELGWEHG